MFNKSWKNKLIAFCTAVIMVSTVLWTPISVYAEDGVPVDAEIVENLEENEVNEVNEIIDEPSDGSEDLENTIENYEFSDETPTVYTEEIGIEETVDEECTHDFVYQTCYNGKHKQVCLLCGKENEEAECTYTYEIKNETRHIAKCLDCSFVLEKNHEFETISTGINSCKDVCKYCGYEMDYETTLLEKTVGDYVITAEGVMPAGVTLSVRKIRSTEKINSIVESLVDSSAESDFEAVQEIVTESEAKQEEIINEEIAVLDEVEDAAEIEAFEEELINIGLGDDEEVVIESPETTPVVCSFDITLLDENGNEWQPVEHGTTVNISISLLGGSLPEDIGIVRIEDIENEEYTELEVNEKDDTSVSFDTDHFTVYTIYNINYNTTIAYSGTVSTDGSGSISYKLYSNGILHLTGKVGSYSNSSSSKNFQMIACRINKWNFPTYNDVASYSVGDNVYYDGTYYTCVTAGSGSIDNFEEITDEETLAFTQVKKVIIDLDEGCFTTGLFCGMHNLEVAIFADGMSGQTINGEGIFNYDENLKYIIFNGVKFSNLQGAFTGCSNLVSVKGLCGESVSSLGKAFIGTNSLTTLDLSDITLADDGDCYNMLYNNPNLKYIDLSTISTTSTNTIYYSDYFSPTFAPSLTTFKTPCVGSVITLPYEMYLEGTGEAYTEIAENTPSMTLYKNSTGTASDGEYTVVDGKTYVYSDAVYTWDVSDAEDGSVMAYIWADGLMLLEGDGLVIGGSSSHSGKSSYNDYSEAASIYDTVASRGSSGGFGSSTTSDKYIYANWRTGKIFPWTYKEPQELITRVVVSGNVKYNSNSTNMFSLPNMKSIDVSGLNISEATRLDGMFSRCVSLSSVDMSSLSADNVTTIPYLFYNCINLISVNMSFLDGASLSGNNNNAFYNCKSLTSINLENIDFSGVTNISYFFSYCESLSSVTLPKTFINQNTVDISRLFLNCKSLASLDTTGWCTDPSKTLNITSSFKRCGIEGTLDLRFVTSSVQGYEVFAFMQNVEIIDISNFGENVSNEGPGCTGFTGFDFSDPENVKKQTIWYRNSEYFNRCFKLKEIRTSDNFRLKGSLYNTFACCHELETIDLEKIVSTTEPITDVSYMFDGCDKLQNVSNLDKLNFDECTMVSSMFSGCYLLESVDFGENTFPKCWNYAYMFEGCKSLTAVDLSKFAFNGTPEMKLMFYTCPADIVWGERTITPGEINQMYDRLTSSYPSVKIANFSSFDMSKLYTGTDMSYSTVVVSPHVIKTPQVWKDEERFKLGSSTVKYQELMNSYTIGDEVYMNGSMTTAPVNSVLVTNDHEDADSDGVCDICGYIFPIDMTVAVTDGTAMYTGSPIVCNAQIDVMDPAEGYAIEYITTQPVSDPANITVKTDGTYKFEQDGDTWTSNNKGVKSSEAVTEWEITIDKNVTLPISYTVSSEKKYDKFNLYVDDVNVVTDLSGYSPAVQGAYQAELSAGTHTIKAKYSKDSSMDSGNDCVAIKFEGLTEQIVSDTMPSFIEIGSYQIRFRVTGVVGYNDYEGTVNFSITKPFGPWIIDEKTYTVEDAIYAWDISKLEDGSVKAFVFDDGLMIWDGEGAIVGEGFDRPYVSSSSESPNLSEISSAATFNPSYNSSGGYFVDGSIIYTGTTWREKHIWPWTCADTMRAVTKLRVLGDIKTDTEARSMFFLPFCETMDLTGLDTSACTNMASMFQNAEYYDSEGCALKTITFGPNFNTSNVVNMSDMFNFCKNLQSLDLSCFDTSNVKYMDSMFYDCGSEDPNFTFTIPDSFVTSTCETLYDFMWNLGKNATDFNFDFVKTWDTSNVISMNTCFMNCGASASVSEIDCTGFDFGKVKSANNMFNGSSAESILFDLSNTDFANCTSAYLMFENCKNLEELNLAGMNTANITNMQCMFSGCTNLEYLDISSFDMSNISGNMCIEFLYNTPRLVKIKTPQVLPSDIDTTKNIAFASLMEDYNDPSKVTNVLTSEYANKTLVKRTKFSVSVPASIYIQESNGNFDISAEIYTYNPDMELSVSLKNCELTNEDNNKMLLTLGSNNGTKDDIYDILFKPGKEDYSLWKKTESISYYITGDGYAGSYTGSIGLTFAKHINST